MHPAILDLRFQLANLVHDRNAPSLCGAAGASSIIFLNVHFFVIAIVIVDFYSFLESSICGNPT
ncbi:hypothetical protein EFD55_12195 [Rhizobium pisi]|uniref:Uncharacterized protein n=2 Tax=Rhizobium TaxID=379 RepID=A0ABY0B3R0_9HYPH|nr:hypothetical protein EFD55_12195 [Rhizobium pisi]RUM10120.1 hypothetical protein EFB14_25275 [Rhizobium fabae]TCA60495.1 hypothetical protein E0J16_06785 [Rhizobium pisi]